MFFPIFLTLPSSRPGLTAKDKDRALWTERLQAKSEKHKTREKETLGDRALHRPTLYCFLRRGR